MRCDYFLDEKKLGNIQLNKTALSQVEINTLGCGGTTTPSKMVELHKYILKKINKNEYIDKVFFCKKYLFISYFFIKLSLNGYEVKI
jgi:hypothetical protein